MQTTRRPIPRGAVRYLEEILHDRATRRRVFAVLACLSFVVAFVVAWSLKLTGISMTDEAFCGKPEHVHTDACITRTLVCGQEEHAHADACYETRQVLTCTQEEHTHSAEAGCYDADGNLICTQAEHVHSAEAGCYTEVQVLACNQAEHAHTDACYEDTYTCNLEEHVHTAACYSNAQADLETADDWEATLPELTGRSAEDLVAVATSQLGTAESVQNFQLDEDGATRRGYSRYGAWYGNPYGAWGTMFVDFCLSYAGNASYDALVNSGANAMLLSAQQASLFHDAAEAAQGLADQAAYEEALAAWEAARASATEQAEQGDQGGDAETDAADGESAEGQAEAGAATGAEGQAGGDATASADGSAAEAASATQAGTAAALADSDAGSSDMVSPTKPAKPTTYAPRAGDLLFLDLDADGQADCVDIVESVDADAYELSVIQGDSNSEGVQDQADSVERVTYGLGDSRILGFAKLPRTVDGQPDPDDAQNEDANADGSDAIDATDSPAGTLDSSDAVTDDASAIATLSLDDDASALSLDLSSNGTITVECYAIVNDTATVVATLSGVNQYQDGSVRLVKASDLEPALAALGFSASDITNHLQDGGTSLMPFSGVGGASFWSDHRARVVDGEAYFVSVDNDTALFYLPSVVADASAYGLSGGTSAAGIAQSKTSASDRFYTVSVKATTGDTNPTVNYVRGDAAQTIQVTTAAARNGWRLLDASGRIVNPDEDASVTLVRTTDASGLETYTYTFSNITHAYALEPMPDSTETTVTFDLNLSGTYDKTTAPAVYGVVGYSEIVPSGTYTLPAPTPTSYSYTTTSDKFTHLASFASWTATADGATLGTYAAGESIDLAGFEGKTVTFKANWSEDTQGTVYCYALIDDQKVLVGSSRVAWHWVSERSRYYLAVDDVARLYTAYGIALPDMTTSSRYLVASSHGSNPTLWVSDSSAPVVSIDGRLYIPALDASDASGGNVHCDVYYLPVAGQSESTFTSIYGGSTTTPNAMLSKKTDMLYTVTVRDDVGDVYPSPEVAYVPNGTENYTKVVRNQPEGSTLETPASWECATLDTTAGDSKAVDDTAATTTFTFATVAGPYYIVRSVASTQCNVVYDLNLQQISQNRTDGSAVYNDLEVPSGVINANKELVTAGEVVAVTDSYQVLWPDRTSYYFQWRDSSGNLAKYLHVGTFKGWKVQLSDGTYVPDPSDESADWVITPTSDGGANPALDLTGDAYAGKTVRLVAQWEYTKTGTDDADSSYVNFFVDLVAVSDGTTGWSPSTAASNFTDSLYTADSGVSAGVVRNGSETYDAGTGLGLYLYEQDSEYIVAGTMAAMDFGDGDASTQLKAQLQEGFTRTSKVDGTTQHTFQVDFPSDEEILSKIRSLVETRTKVITMNGHEVKADDLTTDNFSLRWYVFKSSNGDGWHIDGKLVAKSSTVKVTKTFAGSASAIEGVLAGAFAINVNANDSQSGVVHSTWKLRAVPAEDTSLAEGELGYSASSISADDDDSGSITYTWEVPVDQYYTYTLTEAGYTLDDSDLFSVHTRYAVKNSGTSTDNTRGWADYTGADQVSVTPPSITGYGGGTVEGLEVDFLNVYAIPGTIAIDKHDMATNTDMAGVSFKISKQGSADFKVFLLDGVYYVKGAVVDGDALEPDSENDYTDVLTTNEAGRIFLYAGPGTYTLTETPLVEGYENPGTIVMTLAADEDDNWATTKVASVTASGGSKYVGISTGGTGVNNVVDVRNYPYTVDVTLTKKWTDGSKTPVTVQLYRKDTAAEGTVTETPVTGCSATLNGAEDTPWSVTWTDVPLYAEGQLATYFVRETAIGDSSYTADYDDGYKYYKVSYGAATYYKDGTAITNPAYADTIAFTVENARDDAGFTFTKVNDAGVPLEGAAFELYGATELAAALGTDDAAFDDVKLSLTQAEDGTYSLCYDGAAVGEGVAHLSATSGADGNVLFGRQVTRGTYYLFESGAPTNYTADGYVYRITYYDPGYVSERLEGGVWVSYDLNNRFVNAWTRANLTLQKTGKGNVAITGATFELRRLGDDDIYATVGTYEVDAGGRAMLSDLTAGHYCLVETVTPTAYHKLPSPVYFCVEDGKVSFETDEYIAQKGLDDSARAQCGIRSTDATNYILTVNNQTGDLLPATGGTGTYLATAAGAALCTGALGLLYGIHRRRRGEANM